MYNAFSQKDNNVLYKSNKKLSYITNTSIFFELSENFCYIKTIKEEYKGGNTMNAVKNLDRLRVMKYITFTCMILLLLMGKTFA